MIQPGRRTFAQIPRSISTRHPARVLSFTLARPVLASPHHLPAALRSRALRLVPWTRSEWLHGFPACLQGLPKSSTRRKAKASAGPHPSWLGSSFLHPWSSQPALHGQRRHFLAPVLVESPVRSPYKMHLVHVRKETTILQQMSRLATIDLAMPSHPPDREPIRDPNRAKNVLRQWQSAEEFVAHYPEDHPIRMSYEQALAAVAPSFAGVASLPALLAEYFAPAAQMKERATLIAKACKPYGPDGKALLHHMVEQAAYHRRSRQLMATWWTADWQPPQSSTAPAAASPKSIAPAPESQPPPQAPPRRRTRKKPPITQPSG